MITGPGKQQEGGERSPPFSIPQNAEKVNTAPNNFRDTP